MIKKEITRLLAKASGLEEAVLQVTSTEDVTHGDYASNVALVLGKKLGRSPREVAQEIVDKLEKSTLIERVEIAGPGFINFFVGDIAVEAELARVMAERDSFGTNEKLKGKRVMYEYTDPNPFKVFHVGHLMANAIGESLSRLAEAEGATVVRANYQGDVGLHVGKALFGMKKDIANMPKDDASAQSKATWLANSYVVGSKAYKESDELKQEIDTLNKKSFERSDDEVNKLYDKGRAWSLDHFEEIYKILGTKFDHYFFESETAKRGVPIVNEYLKKGVFSQSQGAIVYEGERKGLHTRVFVTSAGLPTYEAKDLGLNIIKFEKEPNLDASVIITGNEQLEYMRVVFAALGEIRDDIAKKSRHLTHGLMLGKDGKKVSSRSGGAPSGEEMLSELITESKTRIESGKFEFTDDEKEIAAERIAVSAIKYSILRQGTGKNVVFDRDQALSFEGESGPYLLYTYARARSLLRKGKEAGFEPSLGHGMGGLPLARVVVRYGEVVEDSASNLAPSTVAQYLLHLAQEMNSYYGREQIVVAGDDNTTERLALVEAVAQVLMNGLTLLGVKVLERM